MTTTIWYTNGLLGAATGELDLVNDDIRVALFRPDHVPDNLNHLTYTQIADGEMVETGYDAGGKPVGGRAWSIVGGRVVLSADIVVWPTVTWPSGFQYAMIYDVTVGNRLVAFINFESTITRAGESVSLVWNAGILALDTQGVA